jgi:hypothetical protein
MQICLNSVKEVGFRNIVSLLAGPKQSLKDELTAGILFAKDGPMFEKILTKPIGDFSRVSN